MTTVAIIVFVCACGIVAGHIFLGLYVLPGLWHWRRPRLADAACPKTMVALNLRGPDPFLSVLLPALLNQDYPNYDVIVVVDHRDDPVHRLAEDLIRASGASNVTLTVLENRRETCSLVCSALLQTIEPRLDRYEAIAMIDADTVPHRGWLRELVAPLADPKVGVATGQRWYFPPRAAWGDLVRYFWNVPAVLQMIFYGIAWGGSLAMRTDVLRKCGVLEPWGRALVQDVPLFDLLRPQGLRIEFVSSILMVNRESVNLGPVVPWIQRQVLWARLYHSCWWKIVVHGVFLMLVPLAALATMAIGLALGDIAAAWWALAALVGLGACTLCQLAVMENLARRIVRGRGERSGWLSAAKLIIFIPAMILTLALYPGILIGAMLCRSIEWRRIHYRIDGPYDVRLLNYQPYQATATQTENISI